MRLFGLVTKQARNIFLAASRVHDEGTAPVGGEVPGAHGEEVARVGCAGPQAHDLQPRVHACDYAALLKVTPSDSSSVADSSVNSPSSVRMGVSSSALTLPAIVAARSTVLFASSEYWE